MRKKKGSPVHGWLVLDKPQGLTSTSAVARVKRLFDARKAGHAGTLDPLATGILPIAFGEATKTVPYIVDGTKSYRFTVRWGEETDTDDSEGQVTASSERRPDRAAIEAAAVAFVGDIQQVPPQYSAVKVEGARAYDLARDGEAFELAARQVRIDSLDLIAQPDAASAVFEARCGKGTYVRALARDMGRLMGCHGHIIALRRTRVGPFGEADAISLESLEQLGHNDAGREPLTGILKPVEAALDDILAISFGNSDALRLKRGQSVLLRGAGAPIQTGPAYGMLRGTLVAVGEIRQGEFWPTRVFNYSE